MKKLLASFLAALVLFPLTSKVVFAAQSTIPEVQQKEAGIINAQTTNQPNLESYGTNTFDGLLTDVYWGLIGGKPTVENASTSHSGGVLNIVYSEGLVGGMGRMIAGIYGSPAATTERYVADILNSAGVKIAQPAYAQGLGFSSLDPILDTWKTVRNVAYLGFVVIFLVIGFLIMLRQQVGQTAVTAQQAIPQIIVALILVTFSYAIAGLLIDLMYLIMYLILTVFVGSSQTSWQPFIDHNFLTLGLKMVGAGFNSAHNAVYQFVGTVLTGDFWQGLLGNIGGIALAVIVAFAIALKIFELFFELLKTYVTIILNITFSPILLMFGAIPGKNPAKEWLGSMIGNLAAFPIVLVVLIVFNKLTGGITGDGVTAADGGFMPPYLLNTGTGFSGVTAMMVGVGMLMIMPELVKKGKEALGAKEGGVFTQLAQDLGSSLKKGVQGGELIPGVGLSKIPGVGDIVKWSGKQTNQHIIQPGMQQMSSRYKAGGIEAMIPFRKVQTLEEVGRSEVEQREVSVSQRGEPLKSIQRLPGREKPEDENEAENQAQEEQDNTAL